MRMNIIISNNSEVPIYQQIYEQISTQIIRGELSGGYCLPPIRTVAKELRVSVITVKRAWEELEHGGYINTMVGKGCFVASLQSKALDEKRNKLIYEKLTKDVQYYKSLGVTLDQLINLIKKYYQL